MKFKRYLNESNRSEEIDQQEAVNIVKKHCMQSYNAFLSKKVVIYRGIPSFGKKYLIVNPSNFTRRSANTKNYYTLLVDNSKKWSKYPKRSKSIICTTDSSYTGAYGMTFIVFPYDNAKIAIANYGDFWDAFTKGLDEYKQLSDFNDELYLIGKSNGVDISDKNIKVFKKSLAELDKKIKFGDKIKYNWMKGYDGNMWKLLEKIFDPKTNGIQLTTSGKPIVGDTEVWTDAKSVMVNITMAELFKSAMENK